MRRIESIEDQMNMVATYEMPDGRRVSFEERHVRELGLAACLRYIGFSEDYLAERLPVFQSGRRVGSLPRVFDPTAFKSKSFFYDPRPGDFALEGDKWIASKALGFGDLVAVPGFVFEPPHSSRGSLERVLAEALIADAAQVGRHPEGQDPPSGLGERSE